MIMEKDKTDTPSPEVSIVILVYNGRRYLEEVLDAVFAQDSNYSYEVIAIDSGSEDGSLEVLGKYPVRLYQVPNREFGHGRTRNLGVRFSAGKYVVFLTQDATPANSRWLDSLVESVAKDPHAAGAYSRQLPRPDCNPIERRELQVGAPPLTRVKKVDFGDVFQRRTYEENWQIYMLFSDVSSCVRKEVFDRHPFNENIVMVEDQEWCKRVIEAGYTVIYMADSCVYHSHNHPLFKIYERHYDYGKSFRDFCSFRITIKNVLFAVIHESALDILFILKYPGSIPWKVRYVLLAPLMRFAMRFGVYKGLKSPVTSSGKA